MLFHSNPKSVLIPTEFFNVVYNAPQDELVQRLEDLFTDDAECILENKDGILKYEGRDQVVNLWALKWAKMVPKRSKTKLLSYQSQLLDELSYLVQLTVHQEHLNKMYNITANQYFDLKEVSPDQFRIKKLRVVGLVKELLS